MATFEERLEAVEATEKVHAGMIGGIENGLALLRTDMNTQFARLREDMNRRFEGTDQHFEAIDHRFDGTDQRLKGIDHRFDTIDRRFEAVDRRFESVDRRFDAVDRRFDLLDAKVSRQFVWLVGVQVMTLAAVVTAMGAILAALAGR
jgi:chromosome segregation ATPase